MGNPLGHHTKNQIKNRENLKLSYDIHYYLSLHSNCLIYYTYLLTELVLLVPVVGSSFYFSHTVICP